MRKYKTFEAISMLNDNPDLKFNHADENGIMFTMYLDEEEYVTVISNSHYTGMDGNIKINDEWTIIQEPVNFTEAVEAYSKEHNIYCRIGNEEHYYTYEANDLGDNIFYLSDDNGVTITTLEILEGTWYIEN
ncbi:MAG: hypothetical protein Q8936_23865 [Bacillota bacterium]|nr:hypothetical protein [Bacillota bacterium]